MDEDSVRTILNRREIVLPVSAAIHKLKMKSPRVLMTGSKGSLGTTIIQKFIENDLNYVATDVEELDVTDELACQKVFQAYKPSHVLHLAADKHAPMGELNPHETLMINSIGTKNIVDAAANIGAKVILTSTCKACDPETVYGASKLIAERIVLNNGGSVARLFNVIDTAGNVFEFWNSLPSNSRIPVTDCHRYFISSIEAISLILMVLSLSIDTPGRYILNPGELHFIPDVAKRLFSDREIVSIPARRGDRLTEPLKANSEYLELVIPGLYKVSSPHDFQVT